MDWEKRVGIKWGWRSLRRRFIPHNVISILIILLLQDIDWMWTFYAVDINKATPRLKKCCLLFKLRKQSRVSTFVPHCLLCKSLIQEHFTKRFAWQLAFQRCTRRWSLATACSFSAWMGDWQVHCWFEPWRVCYILGTARGNDKFWNGIPLPTVVIGQVSGH